MTWKAAISGTAVKHIHAARDANAAFSASPAIDAASVKIIAAAAAPSIANKCTAAILRSERGRLRSRAGPSQITKAPASAAVTARNPSLAKSAAIIIVIAVLHILIINLTLAESDQ